jgi:hypothetical protein
MKSRVVDDKRRVVLPETCPPHCEVTVGELDETTWLVKRQVPTRGFKIVLIPALKRLPDDPEWEKVEHTFTSHASKTVSEPKA